MTLLKILGIDRYTAKFKEWIRNKFIAKGGIKTINNQSIEGEGNIVIEGGTSNGVESEEVAPIEPTPEFPYATKGELTELSTEVSGLSERVDALGEGGSVFEAVYGETSYDEIKEAFEANKVVYCYRETRVYMLTKLEAGAAYFAVTHGNYYYRLVCHPGAPSTSWGATSENFQHSLKSLANGNAQITIAGNTAEVATPQYVENLLGVIINGDY